MVLMSNQRAASQDRSGTFSSSDMVYSLTRVKGNQAAANTEMLIKGALRSVGAGATAHVEYNPTLRTATLTVRGSVDARAQGSINAALGRASSQWGFSYQAASA